jgi:hypothetical protein
MKKITLLAGALLVPFIIMGQNPAVDQLFNKYQGKEGFTTVFVNKDVFKMISDDDNVEHEMNKTLEKISGIKILAQEDKEITGELNFYDELKKSLDFNKYKELVVVKEKDQDVWIIARENNDRIAELLVIVGGDENVLVWIEGNFTFEDLSELSEIDGLEQLELLGEKDHD